MASGNASLLEQLKLFVVDLDGTILGGGHQPYVRIPDKVAAFLDELDAAGCRWAINTTWDPHGQWQLVLASPVKSRPAYFMGELGYRVARCTPEGPAPVEDYCRRLDEKVDRWRREHFHPFLQKVLSLIPPRKLLFYGHLMSFQTYEEHGDELEKLLRELPPDDGLKVLPGKNACTVMPPFLNKGLGLREVLRLEGLEPDQVGVAGDNIMDVAMMQPDMARHLAVPGNAGDDVKEYVLAHGGAVGESPCGEGVIEAFRQLQARRQGAEA